MKLAAEHVGEDEVAEDERAARDEESPLDPQRRERPGSVHVADGRCGTRQARLLAAIASIGLETAARAAGAPAGVLPVESARAEKPLLVSRAGLCSEVGRALTVTISPRGPIGLYGPISRVERSLVAEGEGRGRVHAALERVTGLRVAETADLEARVGRRVLAKNARRRARRRARSRKGSEVTARCARRGRRGRRRGKMREPFRLRQRRDRAESGRWRITPSIARRRRSVEDRFVDDRSARGPSTPRGDSGARRARRSRRAGR